MLDALRGLGLPPRPVPPPWSPEVPPEPTDSAFRVDAFGAYFRGIRFNMRALVGRMQDERDAEELRATERMAASFLDAWKTRRESAS